LTAQMRRIGTEAAITQLLADSYSVTTSEATRNQATGAVVNGFFDKANNGRTEDGATDMRINSRVFVVPTIDKEGEALTLALNVGYQLTIGDQQYSVRRVEPEIADNVTVLYRLFLDQA